MADYVVTYTHSHEQADELEVPSQFLVEYAHAAIDAGDDVFGASGPHVLRGIEIYKGRPIFYSLGNFIFHTREMTRWPALVWRSVLADLRLGRGQLKGMTLTPILLNEQGTAGDTFFQTRGAPRLAHGEEAASILNRLAKLSGDLGTTLKVNGTTAELVLK
jgi:poly-gamma-glutamate synthesis protein (capsule biosynthesis protein)